MITNYYVLWMPPSCTLFFLSYKKLLYEVAFAIFAVEDG